MAKKRTVGKAMAAANHASVQRYAAVILVWVILSFWLLVCGSDFKAGLVYTIMALGGLGGYVIVMGIWGKK